MSFRQFVIWHDSLANQAGQMIGEDDSKHGIVLVASVHACTCTCTYTGRQAKWGSTQQWTRILFLWRNRPRMCRCSRTHLACTVVHVHACMPSMQQGNKQPNGPDHAQDHIHLYMHTFHTCVYMVGQHHQPTRVLVLVWSARRRGCNEPREVLVLHSAWMNENK